MQNIIEKLDDIAYQLEDIADEVGKPDKACRLCDAACCIREAIGELENCTDICVDRPARLPADLAAIMGKIQSLL